MISADEERRAHRLEKRVDRILAALDHVYQLHECKGPRDGAECPFCYMREELSRE